MASLLRVFPKRCILKSFDHSSLINKCIIRTVFTEIRNIGIANNNKVNQGLIFYKNTRQKIENSVEKDNIENYKSQINDLLNKSNELTSENLDKLDKIIYLAKTDEDIEFILNSLKKIGKYSNVNLLSRVCHLLIHQNKIDKIQELLHDKELEALIFIRSNRLLFIKKLYENKRYSEVVDFYEKICINLSKPNTMPILPPGGISEYFRALYYLNTPSSLDKAKNQVSLLKKINYMRMNYSALIVITLLSINQNDLNYAFELLQTQETLQTELKEHAFFLNLKAIVAFKQDQLDEAKRTIEKALNSSTIISSKLKRIFPLTVKTLKEKMETSADKTFVEQIKRLNVWLVEQNAVSSIDLEELALNYNYIRPKLGNKNQTNNNQNQKASSPSNKSTEKYRNIERNQSMSITNKSKSDDEDNHEDTNTKQSELSKLNNLHIQGKYSEFIQLFMKIYAKNEIELPTQFLTKFTTQLVSINTKESFEKCKKFLELKKNPELSDDSKLHIYLLAISQNDPYFALGFIAMYGIDSLSISLYRNLKAIALCKQNKLNDASIELEQLVDMNFNKFANQGYVFPYVLKVISETIKNSNDATTNKKLKGLVKRITDENRLLNVDLFEFCSINTITERNETNQQKKNENKSTKISTDKNENTKNLKEKKQIFANVNNILQSNENLKDNNLRSNVDNTLNVSRLNEMYDKRLYQTIYDYFSKHLVKNGTTLTKSNIDLICRVLFEEKRFSFLQIKKIIVLLKDKKLEMSYNALIDIYLAILSKKEALFALELLADLNKNENLAKQNSSIYKNLIAIGFSFIGKFEISLVQIEELLKMDVDSDNKNNFNGKLFPYTLKCLKLACKDNLDFEKKLDEIVTKAINEKRICNIDITHLPELS